MSETILNRYYLLTDPAHDVWMEITDDIMQDSARWTKGILANGPLDRVGNVGQLSFMLLNDAGSGTADRYTPGHPNCTRGFGVKAAIMLVSEWRGVIKCQWIGYIPRQGIKPMRSGLAAWMVEVTVYDWMYFALNSPVTLQEIGVEKTLGEQGEILAGLPPVQPNRVDTTDYSEIFPTVGDMVREKTTVYRELVKLAKSEVGFAYLTYRAAAGERDTLMLEGRTHRDTVPLFDAAPKITADCPKILTEDGGFYLTTEDGRPLVMDQSTPFEAVEEFTDYEVVTGAHFANRWLGKAYPREAGGTGVVLFQLHEPIHLEPGETRNNLRVSYVVAEGAVKVSAQNVSMSAAVMNTLPDGTGTDVSSDLDATGEYGASDALLSVTNNSGEAAEVISITLTGDPIYIRDTVTVVQEIAETGDALYGQVEAVLDQKYMADPNRTREIITMLAVKYSIGSETDNTVNWTEFCVNENEINAAIYMLCDSGSQIPVRLEEYGIFENYFIQGSETWEVAEKTFCRLYLKPARMDSYLTWELGVPGYSELGQSTILGLEL